MESSLAVNNTMEPFVFSFISPLESILLFLQTKLRTHNNCLFTQFNVSILIIDHSKDSDQCFGWFVFFLWRCAVTSLGPGHARGSFLIDVGKFGRKIKYLSFQVLVIKYVVTILMRTVVKKLLFFYVWTGNVHHHRLGQMVPTSGAWWRRAFGRVFFSVEKSQTNRVDRYF